MRATRIFFATDIHGSERVFFKFLNVRLVHKVDAIILGGDITGKLVIPLVEQIDGSYKANFLGSDWTAKSDDELEALEKNIRFNGFYPYRTNPDEVTRLEANKIERDQLFSKLMVETLQRWIHVTEERLKGSGVKCYISPGNDDRFDIDNVIDSSSYAVNPEGHVVKIDDIHEMISVGWTNPTPWNTTRECSEEELASKIEAQVSQVKDMKNCIFNFHAPPYNSKLDIAPKLDETLKPVLVGTQVQMIPVGSLSVRKAIEKHQPLLGMHGHIHESKGFNKIGRTVCLNPGSNYQEGLLRGSIIVLGDGKLIDYMHLSG